MRWWCGCVAVLQEGGNGVLARRHGHAVARRHRETQEDMAGAHRWSLAVDQGYVGLVRAEPFKLTPGRELEPG